MNFLVGIIIFTLTLVVGYNWVIVYRKMIDEANQLISERIDKIIARTNQYKTFFGEKYLTDRDLIDEHYTFIIGAKEMEFSFSGIESFIKIEPIESDDKLDFKAKVNNGKLMLKIKNFNSQKHKGVRWKITYLDG